MRRIRALIVGALLVLLCSTASVAAAGELVVQSVNTSAYPAVALSVALPNGLGSSSSKPSFEVLENGEPREVKVAEPLAAADRAPIDVVLMLDASGSMKGKPLVEAQRAARAFVDSMGPSDRVAIISFSSTPALVTDFTTDRAMLHQAIDSVEAKGETALYDALAQAAGKVGEAGATSRYVVLLSDGGDTVSVGGLDEAIGKLTSAGAPVYAVALSSPEYNPAALKAVAKKTRGRQLSAGKAEELSSIFSTIARDIQDVWTVSFRSHAPDTPDLELVVSAHRGGQSARSVTLVRNPSFLEGAGGSAPAVTFGLANWLTGWGIALVGGLAIGMIVFGVGRLLEKEGAAIRQLDYYHELRRQSAVSGESVVDPESMSGKLRATVSAIASRRGFTADLKSRLERAGVRLRPDEMIYFHLLTVVLLAALAQIFFRSLPVTALVTLIAAFLPTAVLDFLAGRRKSRFEADLPDIVSLISGSLRAGWGIQQSIDLIVDETSEPASSEFRRVQSETRLGLSLEESLGKMAERLDSDDFRWIVAAIGIQREVGGNLAEVLDIAATTIRERAELRREVVALTAEGRFSAIVLVVLPFVMLLGLSFIAPKYLSNMTASFEGWIMLGLAGVLLLVGSVWLMRVSKVEV